MPIASTACCRTVRSTDAWALATLFLMQIVERRGAS